MSSPLFTSASSAALTEVSTDTTNTRASTAMPTMRFVTKTVEAATATATMTETTTATTTTTPAGGGTGLSTAGITGIAVTLGVAALALMLLCFTVFFRRKRRHLNLAPPAPVAEACPDASSELSLEEPGTITGFAGLPYRFLLIGASGSEVRGQLASLGLLIEHHVLGNYHRDNILVTPATLHASLRKLQLTEDTVRMVARLSIDPNTRYVAIRHLLALVIFSNLNTHSVGLLSLLPPALKEMSRSRPRASQENRDSLVETALVSWNLTTAFLMHENPHTRTPLLPPPSVEPQIKALVTPLQEFLVHFVRIDDHSLDDQQARLAGIFRQCVKYGYEVFSHPCDWEFTFPQQEKGIVVVPGLKYHSSSMGELYDPPMIVLTPEVVAADSMKNQTL